MRQEGSSIDYKEKPKKHAVPSLGFNLYSSLVVKFDQQNHSTTALKIPVPPELPLDTGFSVKSHNLKPIQLPFSKTVSPRPKTFEGLSGLSP